jgi:hypothetical protein
MFVCMYVVVPRSFQWAGKLNYCAGCDVHSTSYYNYNDCSICVHLLIIDGTNISLAHHKFVIQYRPLAGQCAVLQVYVLLYTYMTAVVYYCSNRTLHKPSC